MTSTKKWVTTNEYYAAFNEMREKFYAEAETKSGWIDFCNLNGNGDKIEIGFVVNSEKMNTYSAIILSNDLRKAADMAHQFKYNGYIIPYEWCVKS